MVIELNKYEGTDDGLEDEEESSEGGGLQHSHLQTAGSLQVNSQSLSDICFG